MVPLEEIFCFIDDFCKLFENAQKGYLLPNPKRKRNKLCRLSLSEIMTILVLFQFSHYRTFKDFFLNSLVPHYKQNFPELVSYNRFIELIPYAAMPLLILLMKMSGEKTGRYIIDSTKLEVCHNLRINRHKVFSGLAKRGKTSTGWFFGFKLHIVINHKGDIMSFKITAGNTDDRAVVEKLMQGLEGWLVGDKGYISQKLSKSLASKSIELITNVRKNMKQQVLEPLKQWWLSKRRIVETVIDQLKAILHTQHTRHRSPANFFTNILAALLAYTLKPKKPSVSFTQILSQKTLLISN